MWVSLWLVDLRGRMWEVEERGWVGRWGFRRGSICGRVWVDASEVVVGRLVGMLVEGMGRRT